MIRLLVPDVFCDGRGGGRETEELGILVVGRQQYALSISSNVCSGMKEQRQYVLLQDTAMFIQAYSYDPPPALDVSDIKIYSIAVSHQVLQYHIKYCSTTSSIAVPHQVLQHHIKY